MANPKLAILALLLLSPGCASKRVHLMSHEEVLDRLGYVGPNRAVYLVGSDVCYTDRDDLPFPQKDLKCY